jgi:hypothetical protein
MTGNRNSGLRPCGDTSKGETVVEIDAVTLGYSFASAFRPSGPLILASLGELVSGRAGVFNIGHEGERRNPGDGRCVLGTDQGAPASASIF